MRPILAARLGMGMPGFGSPDLSPVHEALWQQIVGEGQAYPEGQAARVTLAPLPAGQESQIGGFPFAFPEDFLQQLMQTGRFRGVEPGGIGFRHGAAPGVKLGGGVGPGNK
jgi:hypothetical protein